MPVLPLVGSVSHFAHVLSNIFTTKLTDYRVWNCMALLQDAPILALDEATANVDSTTEALIQQTLKDCTRGKSLGGRRYAMCYCCISIKFDHKCFMYRWEAHLSLRLMSG